MRHIYSIDIAKLCIKYYKHILIKKSLNDRGINII